jgi:signal recognition particle GTPase
MEAGLQTAAVLPEPRGKQREVVALKTTGHAVVLGTAGSGKTTMAIHRAAYLGDVRTSHAGKVLLCTFNTNRQRYHGVDQWRFPIAGTAITPTTGTVRELRRGVHSR